MNIKLETKLYHKRGRTEWRVRVFADDGAYVDAEAFAEYIALSKEDALRFAEQEVEIRQFGVPEGTEVWALLEEGTWRAVETATQEGTPVLTAKFDTSEHRSAYVGRGLVQELDEAGEVVAERGYLMGN